MNAVIPLSSHGVLETEVPQIFYLGFYLDCDAEVLLTRLHVCCSFSLLLLPSFLLLSFPHHVHVPHALCLLTLAAGM